MTTHIFYDSIMRIVDRKSTPATPERPMPSGADTRGMRYSIDQKPLTNIVDVQGPQVERPSTKISKKLEAEANTPTTLTSGTREHVALLSPAPAFVNGR